MNTHATVQSRDDAAPAFMRGRGPFLRRECRCRSATLSLTGEFADCKGKKQTQATVTIGVRGDVSSSRHKASRHA